MRLSGLRDIIGSRLSRSLFGTFAAGVASRLALLAMAVVVARQLLPEGYGAFVFATSAAVVAGHLAGFGLPALVSRLIPTYKAKEEWSLLRGLLRWCDITVVSGCILVFAALLAIALFAGLSEQLRGGLVLTMVLLLPSALMRLRKSELTGARRPAASLLLGEAIAPGSVALFALLVGVDDVASAVTALAVATIVALIIATIYLRHALPTETWSSAKSFQGRLWFAAALPLLGGTTANLLMNRMDILMLAPLAGLQEVGLYGAAFRVTYALIFPQLILMNVLTPFLSANFANNDMSALWRHFRFAMAFSAVTIIPITLPLYIWSELVLSVLFGNPYIVAAGSFRLLVLAQCFSALSIVMVGVLIAVGGAKFFATLSVVAIAINGALNLVFIPKWGAEGAAFSTLLAFGFLALGYIWVLSRMYRTGSIKPPSTISTKVVARGASPSSGL